MEKCKEKDVKCSSFLLTHGHAREDAVDFAATNNIDTILVGNRGLGAVQRMWLGSFSQYIVNHAPCDVVVVKETKTPQ